MYDLRLVISKEEKDKVFANIDTGIRKAMRNMDSSQVHEYNKYALDCAAKALSAQLGYTREGLPKYGIASYYLHANTIGLLDMVEEQRYTRSGILHTAGLYTTYRKDVLHAKSDMLAWGLTNQSINIDALVTWIDNKKALGAWKWNVRNSNKTSRQQAFSIHKQGLQSTIGGKMQGWDNVFTKGTPANRYFVDCVNRHKQDYINAILGNFLK